MSKICKPGWELFDGECFQFFSGSQLNQTCKPPNVYTKDQQIYVHHKLLLLGWTMVDVTPISKYTQTLQNVKKSASISLHSNS